MGALAPLTYKINYFKSDPYQYKNILNNLEELRKSAGLTQQDLSESAGVSRKSINAIENGIYIPSTVLALKISKTLKCKVEDLFKLPK